MWNLLCDIHLLLNSLTMDFLSSLQRSLKLYFTVLPTLLQNLSFPQNFRLTDFFMAQQPLVVQGLLIIESLRLHSDTPLDEWSARLRDLYLTTHNTYKRQTSMLPAGFEPAIPACDRPQTRVLDSTATGIDNLQIMLLFIVSSHSVRDRWWDDWLAIISKRLERKFSWFNGGTVLPLSCRDRVQLR
jgi:hypothetical protein